jgi:CRP-like cAMP-binding protein
MPKGKYPLKHRDERRAVAQLFIELTRAMRRSINETGNVDGDLLLVAAAVMVGHAEDRPMTAAKIAHYVELPRTTVLRKLDELAARDLLERVGTAYVLSKPRAANATVFIEAYVRLIGVADKSLRESPLRPRP